MLDPDSGPDAHCNADPQQCSKAKKKAKMEIPLVRVPTKYQRERKTFTAANTEKDN
jgi:hypothetical protein